MADSHGCIVRIREKKIAGGNISLYLDIQREGLLAVGGKGEATEASG